MNDCAYENVVQTEVVYDKMKYRGKWAFGKRGGLWGFYAGTYGGFPGSFGVKE